MKNRKLLKLFILGLFMFSIIIMSCITISHNYLNPNSNNIADIRCTTSIEDSTKENFIYSMAKEQNIYYSQAEKEFSKDYVLPLPGEVVKYATCKKRFPLPSESEIIMTLEVAYVYNENENKIKNIQNIGPPLMAIEGDILVERFNGSVPNIEKYATSARISITGQATGYYNYPIMTYVMDISSTRTGLSVR